LEIHQDSWLEKKRGKERGTCGMSGLLSVQAPERRGTATNWELKVDCLCALRILWLS
ncbi:hypothetical protein JRQ81_002829, partial [Phrynocephalus forsythii]